MTTLRRILVTGATGKQGGALIRALLASPPSYPFELVALTRNVDSSSAKALAARPNVSLLQGDFEDIPAIFRKAGNLYGVFSVQTPLNHVKEEKDGKALATYAAKNGVEHFIYASVERGGPEKSDWDPTPVPHFISKFNIEEHLKAVAAETKGRMRWTIIRPVAFMDNLDNTFFGRVFGASWRLTGRRMQIVGSQSIGVLGADAFRDVSKYEGRSLSLATDDLSFEEANRIFKAKFGRDMPNTYDSVARLVQYLAWKQLGIMFKWIRDESFGANHTEFRDEIPGMQNFEEWLEDQADRFQK